MQTLTQPAPVAVAPVRRGAGSVRLLLALLSGVVLHLAFPPHGWWPLAPLGVALLLGVVRGQTGRRGLLLGLLHGLGFFVPLLVWTGTIAGAPAWLALAFMEACFLALLGGALAVVQRRPGWPVWTAGLWVAQEALRDRQPFGGFPWGRLAFSQGDSPLTPLASLGGAPLVTFAVALLGALGLAVLDLRGGAGERPARPAWSAALAPVLVLLALLVPTPVDGPTVTVAVIQGNVPRLGLPLADQQSAVLDNHVRSTLALAADVAAGRVARPDVVIWPENASDLDPYTEPEAAAAIDGAVRAIGVPLLVGAVTDGPGRFVSNRGIVWDPVTGPGASYVKRHPVPFGEYIPLRGLVRTITTKVDLVPNDFIQGDRPGVLQLGPARIGDVICFEVAYDGVVRDAVRAGGRLLVVQTNNASFGRSGETTQQLAMSRLRAVEHGRAVIVSATSGVSAVIAPDGSLQDRTGIFTADRMIEQVPLRDSQTPATRLGAVPELLLALAGAGALLLALVRR